jgi:hypothetical protein
MPNPLIQMFNLLRNGSHNSGLSLRCGATLVHSDLFFEVHKRDRAGNDFAHHAVGPISRDIDDDELGRITTVFLRESAEVGEYSQEMRQQLWAGVLKEMGFASEKNYVKSARHVMLFGVDEEFVEIQACYREKGNFVGVSADQIVRTKWSVGAVGAALRQVLLQLGTG